MRSRPACSPRTACTPSSARSRPACKPGRASDTEITVADLTGLGIQDTAVANLVMAKAIANDVGRLLASL